MSPQSPASITRPATARVLQFGLTLLSGLALSILWSGTAAGAQPRPRERVSFNDNWRFQQGDPAGVEKTFDLKEVNDWLLPQRLPFKKTDVKAEKRDGTLGGSLSYVQPSFDDHAWRSLNLPHDWGVEGDFKQEYEGETGKLPWWGIGWYRKQFTLSETDKNRHIYLDIDGAMSNALVWINGHLAGGWPYGYASFRVDLTPYINLTGANTVAIRLDNPPRSSRWYPGGGIYRNVWLIKTSPVQVNQWGVQLTTPDIASDKATIVLSTTIRNTLTDPVTVNVHTEIFALDAKGLRQGSALAKDTSAPVVIPAASTGLAPARLTVANPRLWTPATPSRYVAVTTVVQNGATVDEYETPFGIRSIKFDPDQGFLLNGSVLKIQGVCNHHDLGALGSAISTRALERQIELLQEMGCNAIRTSHNPPAPELVDLCDRMGMMLMVEAFDCWASGKKPNDYSRNWYTWHEADLRSMVRHYRNHPSVIIWSTGNEISEQWGRDFSQKLTDIIHEEDTTRPVSAGCNYPEAGFNGFQNSVDVFGYNYKAWNYGKFHEKNPTIPIYGSETASTISSRGEYFFPLKAGGQSDFQVSSYDLYYPGWATNPDTEFAGQDKNPFVAGEFVWTGFDYLGEPTPYNKDSTNLLNVSDPKEKERLKAELDKLGKIQVPSRSSYFGILDLAGFKKDRFYLYQARWRPELPMAHILPHWNWPERLGQVTPVHVYTSGDEAELFLNGQSLGRKKKGAYEYRLRWDDVKYTPGELKVVAYKNGKPWATDTVKTTGPAAKLTLAADHTTITADGRDLSYVTVSVTDKDGLMVPRSKQLLRFEISGPGEIVATDNGDATDHTSFKSLERNAFNGLALVIVRSKPGQSGPITIKASSAGLTTGQTTIKSR